MSGANQNNGSNFG